MAETPSRRHPAIALSGHDLRPALRSAGQRLRWPTPAQAPRFVCGLSRLPSQGVRVPQDRSLLGRLRSEPGAALLLVVVTVVALAWANSPWSHSYHELWETHLSVALGSFGLDLSLHHWVNDGLMVIFFFVVGLEVRQELAVGSLRDRRRALVPLVAGFLGVAVPAAIYLAIAGREAAAGWGAVVGTDTAFLLGALALVGPAMSNQLRIFLLTLTVVDDFLAVSIIGVFYTEDLQVWALLVALLALVALYLLGRTRQWRSSPYVAIVIVLWLATLESGIHPSIAGMVAGLLVPAYETHRSHVEDAQSRFRDFWQSPRPTPPARCSGAWRARSPSTSDCTSRCAARRRCSSCRSSPWRTPASTCAATP
nr:Na+/H+ antiporter NhaA [Kineosphaera limosa]